MATTHHIPYRLSCRQATAEADVPAGVGKGSVHRPWPLPPSTCGCRLTAAVMRRRTIAAGLTKPAALAWSPAARRGLSPQHALGRPQMVHHLPRFGAHPAAANPTCHLRHPVATVHRAYGSFAGHAPSEPIRALRIGIEPPFLLTWNRFASHRPGELQGGDDQ